MNISSSRTDFINSWLSYVPENLIDTDGQLLKRMENFDYPIINLGNGYFKKESTNIAYYWRHDTTIEVLVKYQSLVVNCIAINDSSMLPELYQVILKDAHKAIRLGIDMLSEYGRTLWETLMPLGYSILVYHKKAPGATMQSIETIADMEYFFKQYDCRYKFWEYVLCNTGVDAWETVCRFRTRSSWEIIEDNTLGVNS